MVSSNQRRVLRHRVQDYVMVLVQQVLLGKKPAEEDKINNILWGQGCPSEYHRKEVKKVRTVVYLIIITMGLISIGLAEEPNLSKELELTPQQIKEIRVQRQSNMHIEAQLITQLETQQKMLNNELECSEPNQAKVKELVQNINKFRGEMYEHRVSVRMQTQKMLTAEQRLRYQELTEASLKQNFQKTRQMGGSSGSGSGRRMGR